MSNFGVFYFGYSTVKGKSFAVRGVKIGGIVMEEQEVQKTVETVDNTEKKEVKAEKTFTRDEVNKMISAEKDKIRKELEAEKTEAERLAKLSSEERLKEEMNNYKTRAEKSEAMLNAYQLKDQTVKDNSDIPADLINLIDFNKYNTAELVKEELDKIKAVYKKAVESGVNESLKEKTPVTKLSDTVVKKKNVSRYSI